MSLRSFVFLTCIALALAGCPKKQPAVEPPTPEPATPREPAVEISGVKPDSTTLGRAVTVSVQGRGFEEGAELFLGSRKPGGVDVLDGGEITFRVDETVPVGRYDVRVVNPDGEQAVMPGGFTVLGKQEGGCVLGPIVFDYDQAVLSAGMRQAIAHNKSCAEQKKFTRLRLEGHADSRGETEYNLALGQRRADSVKSYLANLGFPGGSITTVSYGEERPVVSGHDESAWSQNRRVEFVGN